MKKFVTIFFSLLVVSFCFAEIPAPSWISIGIQVPFQYFQKEVQVEKPEQVTFDGWNCGLGGSLRVNWDFDNLFYFGIDLAAGGIFYDHFFELNLNVDFGYWRDFKRCDIYIGGFVGYEFQMKNISYSCKYVGSEKVIEYESLQYNKGNVGADFLVNFKLSEHIRLSTGCKVYASIGCICEKKKDNTIKFDKQDSVYQFVVLPSVNFIYHF